MPAVARIFQRKIQLAMNHFRPITKTNETFGYCQNGTFAFKLEGSKNFTNEPRLIFLYESKVSWDTKHILRKCPKFFLFVTELLLKWSIQIYGCSLQYLLCSSLSRLWPLVAADRRGQNSNPKLPAPIDQNKKV